MTFKKIIRKIHLWLGFIAGLVVVINLVPASIFAFNSELKEWYYHDKIFVANPGINRIPLSKLKEKLEQTLDAGSGSLSYAAISSNPGKAYCFRIFKENKNPGFSYFSESAVDKEIYIDPYTGKIQGVIDLRYDWIKICEAIHRRMLLHYNYGGHWIIAYATLIIIFSVLTGLVLWFPKNKAMLKQRFSFKRNVRWRRRNYDVHNVGGFYTHIVVLFLAVTGLIWSFDWWANGFYQLLGEDYKTMEAPYQEFAPKDNTIKFTDALDISFADVLSKRKTWDVVSVIFPESGDRENRDKISFYLSFNNHTSWDESDQYVYINGQIVKQALQEQKSVGVKWSDSNYAFHTGSIYGLPGKILMCLTTLFCASLPVTGFIIWYGKRKKSTKRG